MECGVAGEHYETPHFHPRHRTHPPGMALPRTECVRFYCLRTGVGYFRSSLHTNKVWPFCSLWVWRMDEQTIGHVFCHCSIRWPLHGVQGLTALEFHCSVPFKLNVSSNDFWTVIHDNSSQFVISLFTRVVQFSLFFANSSLALSSNGG